jgi:hypothetical protein
MIAIAATNAVCCATVQKDNGSGGSALLGDSSGIIRPKMLSDVGGFGGLSRLLNIGEGLEVRRILFKLIQQLQLYVVLQH